MENPAKRWHFVADWGRGLCVKERFAVAFGGTCAPALRDAGSGPSAADASTDTLSDVDASTHDTSRALMSLYWHFDLESLAARSLYLQDLEGTETMFQVNAIIEAFRHGVKARPRVVIPV